jgi:hypothetical protein
MRKIVFSSKAISEHDTLKWLEFRCSLEFACSSGGRLRYLELPCKPPELVIRSTRTGTAAYARGKWWISPTNHDELSNIIVHVQCSVVLGLTQKAIRTKATTSKATTKSSVSQPLFNCGLSVRFKASAASIQRRGMTSKKTRNPLGDLSRPTGWETLTQSFQSSGKLNDQKQWTQLTQTICTIGRNFLKNQPRFDFN